MSPLTGLDLLTGVVPVSISAAAALAADGAAEARAAATAATTPEMKEATS